MVRKQPPLPSWCIDPDIVRDKIVRKDDEILKQLQSTKARLFEIC